MRCKLSVAEVKEIERERYCADLGILMRNRPTHRGKHGHGPSLFEQYERQSATR